MSDPVVNIEIEDVLASIRRLVAEGEGGRELREAALKPVEDVPQEPLVLSQDKLVLSQDQMVPEEASDPEPESPDETSPLLLMPEQAPKPERPVDGAKSDLLSTIAELEAAITETEDEFEPDGSETTPIVDWAKTTENGAIFGARAATTRILDIADDLESPVTEAAAEDLESTSADVDAPVAPAPMAEDVEWAEETSEPLIFGRAVEDDAGPSFVSEVPAASQPEPEPEPELQDKPEMASEIVRAETSDQDSAAFVDHAAGLDEEALRALVSQIVREELQGVLGERITRNVRKLVRREIYRALSSEDFS